MDKKGLHTGEEMPQFESQSEWTESISRTPVGLDMPLLCTPTKEIPEHSKTDSCQHSIGTANNCVGRDMPLLDTPVKSDSLNSVPSSFVGRDMPLLDTPQKIVDGNSVRSVNSLASTSIGTDRPLWNTPSDMPYVGSDILALSKSGVLNTSDKVAETLAGTLGCPKKVNNSLLKSFSECGRKSLHSLEQTNNSRDAFVQCSSNTFSIGNDGPLQCVQIKNKVVKHSSAAPTASNAVKVSSSQHQKHSLPLLAPVVDVNVKPHNVKGTRVNDLPAHDSLAQSSKSLVTATQSKICQLRRHQMNRIPSHVKKAALLVRKKYNPIRMKKTGGQMLRLKHPLAEILEVKEKSDPFSAQLQVASNEKTEDAHKENEEEACDTEEMEDLEEETEPDNMEDLEALMKASSTIRVGTTGPPKPRSQRKKKDLQENLSMLIGETDSEIEARNHAYACSYFDKVQLNLEKSLYDKFCNCVIDFSKRNINSKKFYTNMEEILKDEPDLIEGLIGFLTPEDALACGRYKEHAGFTKMRDFVQKLEIFFQKTPHHMQKILKVLGQLQASRGTALDLKNQLMPLLRGNKILIDAFLQLFPFEAPPESLMTDFEVLDYPDSDKSAGSDDQFETLSLPEEEDPYGGKDCPCECHGKEDVKYKSREKHCIPCATKFLDGKVYVQTGKQLRPARVIYLENQSKESSNSTCQSSPSPKGRHSPVKCPVSPSKNVSRSSPLRVPNPVNRIEHVEVPVEDKCSSRTAVAENHKDTVTSDSKCFAEDVSSSS